MRIVVKLLLLAVVSIGTWVHAQPLEPGFVPLFDGKTLAGWHNAGKLGGGYSITNGVLFCNRANGHLLTDKEYADFVLRLDYKLASGGNSGIAIRSPASGMNLATIANEIQLLDDNAKKHAKLDPAQYNGSLYKVFPAKRGFANPAGEWNSMEIVADKRYIKVVLNGTTIVDGNLDQVDPKILKARTSLRRATGHLGFLGHRTNVEFRNIRIRELKLDESN